MIGLAVVSHSMKAAKGIAEVTARMGGNSARIVPAGGDGSGTGTSPDRICKGIKKADDGDGVVVLIGFGSAMINTGLAVETAMDSEAATVDAPVLEGTLNAAVEITSRKTALDSVVERTKDARNYRKLN